MSRCFAQDDCQNYIRVAFKKNDEELFVCGTNAFHPMCKTFNLTVSSYRYREWRSRRNRVCVIWTCVLLFPPAQDGTKGKEEMDGRGRCPYDPSHNSTSIYAGDQLYSGTVADFSGGDPLIYKEPMRTERLDFKQLNGNVFSRRRT